MINVCFFILVTGILSLSLFFELNGLILFFGSTSIFIYVGILISLCKIYFGFIYKNVKYRYFIYFFTTLTILFGSLDIYVRYKNSLGLNDSLQLNLDNINHNLMLIQLDIDRIISDKKSLVREYGSANKRADRERELNDLQISLVNKKESLIQSKVELNRATKFHWDEALMKFFMIVGLEVLLLLTININYRNNQESKLSNRSSRSSNKVDDEKFNRLF